jgi:hypothetical protein
VDELISLIITEEGLSALLDAEQGITNAVRIVEIGLTADDFLAAATIEQLPGEHTRISAVAGEAVNDRVIHMVARDDGGEAYTVRGFALYLDDGALFAVYGQETPIFEKSAVSTFLLAADITFAQAIAELIEFGDTNFLYPPATETRKGVAYLATAAEVAAGAVADKIVTPAAIAGVFIRAMEKGAPGGVATLDVNGKVPPSQLPAVDSIDTFEADDQAEMLALPAGPGDFCRRLDQLKTYVLRAAPATLLANWAEFLSPGAPVRTVNGKIGDVVLGPADVGAPPVARSIAAGGLAQGGGSMEANRTITVPKATAAEALAGSRDDVAVTPAALAAILGFLAAAAPSTRQLVGAGLAQGGGDFSADRIITVLKATAADVAAGTADDRAITPAALSGSPRTLGAAGQLQIPGTPIFLKWGTAYVSLGSQVVYFPEAFAVSCWHVFPTFYGNPNNGDESDEPMWVQQPLSPGSFIISTAGDRFAVQVGWLAIGA